MIDSADEYKKRLRRAIQPSVRELYRGEWEDEFDEPAPRDEYGKAQKPNATHCIRCWHDEGGIAFETKGVFICQNCGYQWDAKEGGSV